MARYIDADKIDYTIASVYWGKDENGNDIYRRAFVAFESDVDNLPTADVVPKSEVAREIFEELDFDIANLDFDSGETRAIAIEGVIAKLKKKYTEEE